MAARCVDNEVDPIAMLPLLGNPFQRDLKSSFVFSRAMNVFLPKLTRKAGPCLSVSLVLKNCRERVTGDLRISLKGASVK